jgi:hypothetical protein
MLMRIRSGFTTTPTATAIITSPRRSPWANALMSVNLPEELEKIRHRHAQLLMGCSIKRGSMSETSN